MSVERFHQEMIEAKENNESLAELTSTSKVSIWSMIFYCAAFAMNTLYQLFTQHRTEIDDKIAKQKTHRLAWIQQMYLKYQYGFALMPESDEFDNSQATPDEIEQSKIIKYCAVNESDTKREVIVKIATEENNELAPLGADKIDAIYAYTEEFKGTGVPYRIINFRPDLLRLKIRIFYNPLLMDSSGMSRQNGDYPVEDALREFMKELPFDGALQIQDLSNKLERVQGVKLVQVDLCQSAWIDATINDYGDFRSIDVRKIPESGYFKIENFNGVTYEVL